MARILGIWDVSRANLALGFFLEFQIRLMCAAAHPAFKKIDFVFVIDRARPVTNEKFSSWIKNYNLSWHLGEMLGLLEINPDLGNIFLFDSPIQFENFLLSGKTYNKFSSGQENNYLAVSNHYQKAGRLPRFIFPEIIKKEIKNFIGDRLAVAVGLRVNDFFSPQRNSNLAAWQELFQYAFKNYPQITFLILGRSGEFKNKISPLPNLIFVGDRHLNLIKQLALMEGSSFYMGTCGGLASFAFFSQFIPYLVTRFRPPKDDQQSWLKFGSALPWQDQAVQHLCWEEESKNLLIDKFEDLRQKLLPSTNQ